MIFGDKSTEATVTCGNSEINENDYKKLLGATMSDGAPSVLQFEIHIRSEAPERSVFVYFELIFTWCTTTSHCFGILKFSVVSHLKCRSTLLVKRTKMFQRL